MATGYVPSEAVEQLTRGSFEDLIGQLSESISSAYEEFGAGSPDDMQVLATFAEHVVVTNGEEFYRVGYQRRNGQLWLTKTESIQVPVLRTQVEQRRYLSEAAGSAVASFLAGDYEGVRGRIGELSMTGHLLVPSSPLQEAEENLKAIFDSSRPWRQLYEQHSSHIHRMLWGASGATFRYAPRPKYEGVRGANFLEAEGHYDSVIGDLGLLNEKLFGLWKLIESSWLAYEREKGGFKGIELAGMAEDFERIATDYIEELKTVCQLVETASQDDEPGHTAAMALVYDVVAKHYPSLEVGAKLVQQVATELAEVKK